jgi:hypothetical protein
MVTKKKSTRDNDLSHGSAKYNTCLLHVVASQWTRVALNPFQVIQWSTRPYNWWSQRSTEVREGRATHTRLKARAQTRTQPLSQRIKCARMETWCLEMIKECLGYSSMRLGVPFIAPRQLGAVGGNLGRQFLPSVGWRTGPGAPPDRHCSLSGADCLPKIA